MKLVNLTKHSLPLVNTRGVVVDIPPDPRHIGLVAVGEHRNIADEHGNIFDLNVRYVSEIKGMPESEEGTVYIVPAEVAMALRESRKDIAFATEEGTVRDAGGQLRPAMYLRRITSRIS